MSAEFKVARTLIFPGSVYFSQDAPARGTNELHFAVHLKDRKEPRYDTGDEMCFDRSKNIIVMPIYENIRHIQVFDFNYAFFDEEDGVPMFFVGYMEYRIVREVSRCEKFDSMEVSVRPISSEPKFKKINLRVYFDRYPCGIREVKWSPRDYTIIVE